MCRQPITLPAVMPPVQNRPVLLAFAMSLLAALPAAGDESLERSLAKVYQDWRGAMLGKSISMWQRATAHYRQIVTRNLIISRGLPYPQSIFDIPINPPETNTLKLIECQAVGDTAHLVYFGKIDLGLDSDDIPENLLVLKFLRENGEWKFDTTRFMNLESVPDVRAGLQSGRADFIDRPEFNPSGIVPKTPPNCQKPDYVAMLEVHSFGYETTASLNGFDYSAVADHAGQELIIGGLKRGKNDLKLKIKVTEIPADAERLLEVNALIMTHSKEKPQIRVFTWEHKSGAPPAEIDLSVHVTPSTLRGV